MGKEITITLNGRRTELAAGTTLGALVDRVSPDRARVAVERNEVLVPRATLDETVAEDGDTVEVVTLAGGG